MKEQVFFKELEEELLNHPFKDRFLAELKAHTEDLKEAKNISSKDLSSDLIEKNLGHPKKIKNDFVRIVSPWSILYFWLEGLILGALYLPLILLLSSSILELLDNLALSYSETIVQIINYSVLTILFFIGISLRYFDHRSKTLKGPRLWYAIILLPSLIIILSRFLIPGYFINPIQLFYLLGFLSVNLGLSYTTFKLAKKINGKEKPSINKFFLATKLFIIFYFTGFFIYRTWETYLPFESLNPDFFLIKIFYPVLMLEEMFSFAWRVLMDLLTRDNGFNSSIFFQVFLPGLILVGISGIALFQMFKNKKWYLVRSIIVLYTFSIFLIHTKAYEGDLDFQGPSLDLSKIIEKQEVKLFYVPTKYFHRDEGPLFKYSVDYKNDHFIIQSNAGKSYWINIKDLDEDFKNSSFDIFYKVQKGGQVENRGEINWKWPLDFRCLAGKEERSYASNTVVFESDGKTGCNKLFYKNNIILNSTVQVADVAFSEDGQWMVLVEDGGYDPFHVYLVKIPQK